MSSTPADDPILDRFRATLDKTYGDQLECVVLFGSRARGMPYRAGAYRDRAWLMGEIRREGIDL